MAGGGGPGGGTHTPNGDIVDKTGSTVDANVTVFDAVQANGIVGIGTLKNTGGTNGLIVRESVTDKFGNSISQEHTLPEGWDYPLDPGANFGTPGSQVYPPFTEYKVEVRSAVSGDSTTYELHYIDVSPTT
jgi:hypothetical protein